MQLPGIYVEIKGDYTELEKNLKAAKALVTSQATGISNAMNNALSPDKIRGGLDSLVKQLTTLDRASKVSGQGFTGIKTGLSELKSVAKRSGSVCSDSFLCFLDTVLEVN